MHAPAPSEPVRLCNGEVELAASAATGRITRYGPAGGPNCLWENATPERARSPFPGWLNWGGDKVWIWPEEDWPRWGGGRASPPGDPSPAPHAVEARGLWLRMVSPVIASYGIRIVREIELEPAGTRVAMVNRLEKVHESELALPVAPWALTQLPASVLVTAHLCDGFSPPGFSAFAPNAWKRAARDGSWVDLVRPEGTWAKMGLDADVLAAPVLDWMFVARSRAEGQPLGAYPRHRRAQVFSDPDHSDFRPRELPPYVELEFISPLRSLQVGQSAELRITWALLRLDSPHAGRELLALSGDLSAALG